MRKSDIDQLSVPYPTSDRGQLAASVRSDIPSARKLSRTILRDLNEASFGIPFLSGLPDHERILVSDYLYQCSRSLEENLVEARLHYLEWLDWCEKTDQRMADCTQIVNGDIRTKMPPATKPTDDLPSAFEKLHVCGFFRAVGSGLDCLGGMIIGVLGLPSSLRKADVGRAQNLFRGLVADGSKGKDIQIDFGKFLGDAITSSGPNDWLTWATQYRNMFVHRGRRIALSHLTSRGVLLLDDKGKPILRSKVLLHLADYPDKSDIEAVLIRSSSVLDETAESTMQGIFSSTRHLLETVSEKLGEIWEMRRNSPHLILQPLKQWETPSSPCSFSGYDAAAESVSFDALIGNPEVLHRFRAASALNQQRHFWTGTSWDKP